MIKWDDDLWLLTEQEFDELPDGTRLMSINGQYESKSSETDRDTRFGFLAYGLNDELIESQGLRDRVLLWKIRG